MKDARSAQLSKTAQEAHVSHTSAQALEFRLDHVSIEVPDFADAVGQLDERLGLSVTVSPEAPDRHGRVYLDRGYLEVATHPDTQTWDVGSYFLRYSDPRDLRPRLDRAGLEYRHQVYEGVDGRWDDVQFDVAEVPMPILVRRTEPVEVARNWPPPLNHPHRCGAFTLAAVLIPAPSIERAAEVYERLLAVEALRPLAGSRPDGRRVGFHLGSGTIVLVGGEERRAILLGVASLEVSRTVLSSVLLPTDERGVAWLDPSATSNLAMGLTERKSLHGP